MKKLFIFTGILLVAILAFTLFKGSQDKWICKEGEWIRQGSPKTSQPTTECKGKRIGEEMPAIPPDSTVASFYTWIQKEENTPDDAYKTNPYLADNFKKRLSQSSTTNPFLCSDQKLTSYKLSKSSITDRKAIVQTEQSFDTEKKLVPFELEAVGKEWKITNIECPQ